MAAFLNARHNLANLELHHKNNTKEHVMQTIKIASLNFRGEKRILLIGPVNSEIRAAMDAKNNNR